MRRKRKIILLLVIWAGLISCRTTQAPVDKTPQPVNEQQAPALSVVEAIIVTPTPALDLTSGDPSKRIPVQREGDEDFGGLTLPGISESNIDLDADPNNEANSDVAMLLDAVSEEQLMFYVYLLENFGTRNSFSETESSTHGIGAARRWIYDEFERVGKGRLNVSFDDFDMKYMGLSAGQRNVVATLPGIDPDGGAIIVMAHYDSRPERVTDGYSNASGANDNGSGVALLLESARILSSRTWEQTIIFLALAAEEQGAFGARHYARNAYHNQMTVLASINYDGVGGRADIPQSVRLFAPNMNHSSSGKFGHYYKSIGNSYLPDFPVVLTDAIDRDGRWGDQREFIRYGIPSVRIIESVEDPRLLNSSQDSWDLIDYGYLRKVTQLNVAVMASVANAN